MADEKRIIGHTCIDGGQLVIADPSVLDTDFIKVIIAETETKPVLNKHGVEAAIVLNNFGGDVTVPVVGTFEGSTLKRIEIDFSNDLSENQEE